MGVTFSQFFPPAPSLTEANLARQEGKVFFVTGGSSGVGFELCKILYASGGTVYLAARTQGNAERAIKEIEDGVKAGGGKLIPIGIQLDDLNTMKPAVTEFHRTAKRLDVLWNNAGISNPPAGSKSAQGYELQMAVNCLAPYLLTQLLLPTLQRTAGLPDTAPASTRVVFASSITVDLGPTPPVDLSAPNGSQQVNYANTKMGNWFMADAFQQKAPHILSVTANPGNLRTAIVRHMPSYVPVLVAPLLYHAKFGAYTQLWAGLSENLDLSHGGSYIIPWGRVHPSPRIEMSAAMKSETDGGTGVAAKFLRFCEEQTQPFR